MLAFAHESVIVDCAVAFLLVMFAIVTLFVALPTMLCVKLTSVALKNDSFADALKRMPDVFSPEPRIVRLYMCELFELSKSSANAGAVGVVLK